MEKIFVVCMLMWGDPHIALSLSSPIPGTVTGLPCRFGLPLPPGAAASVEDLGAVGRLRRVPDVAWSPLVLWPDGSLRWVRGRTRLDFQPGKPAGFKVRIRKNRQVPPGGPRANRRGLAVHSDEDFHQVVLPCPGRHPGLTFLFKRRGGTHPHAVAMGGVDWMSSGSGFRLVWLEEEGKEMEGRILHTEVGWNSPGRVQMVSEGMAGPGVRFVLTSTLWAGAPRIALDVQVEGWPAGCRTCTLAFPVPRGPSALVFHRPRQGARCRKKAGSRIVLDLKPTKDCRLEVDGEPVYEAAASCLPLALGTGGGWITVDVEDAGRRGAFQMRVVDDRARLILRDNVAGWTPQRKNRFRIVFAWTPGPPDAGVWNGIRALTDYGSGLVRIPRKALVSWGGIGPLPRHPPASGLEGEAFRRTLDLFLRELDRPEYRTPDDLGDYRVEHLGWANGEYDVILALVRAYLWTGEKEALQWARRAVRHHLDVDLDWKNTGLPRVHGPDHDGGIEIGHTWLRGLLAFGLLTGDPEALKAARGIARGIASFLDGSRNGFGRERDYGWALIALTAAAEIFPEAGFQTYRDRVARDLVAHVHPKGLVCLESTRNPAMARTTTFTGRGVLAPALARGGRLTGNRMWLAMARAMARRYLVEAWNPETEVMAWSLYVDVSSGRVVHRKNEVGGGDLLFLAAGLAAVGSGKQGVWWSRQAVGLRRLGVRRYLRDGCGRDNGDRVRVIHALVELAAHLDG